MTGPRQTGPRLTDVTVRIDQEFLTDLRDLCGRVCDAARTAAAASGSGAAADNLGRLASECAMTATWAKMTAQAIR